VARTKPQLETLFQEHADKLFNIAMRFCGDVHKAEDLVQETFLQAMKSWEQFRGESDPVTWLYTIASRQCKRMHRRRAGQPKQVLSLSQSMNPGGPVPDLPDDRDDPASQQIEKEALAQLEVAITELPVPFRMVLMLKDIVGLSVEQIAGALEIKPATVKTRAHRARMALRDAVTERLPKRSAPPPAYNKQVCIDLLNAKQDAIDRRADFPLPPDFCDRCRAVFRSLDLTADLCGRMGNQSMPRKSRDRVQRNLRQNSG